MKQISSYLRENIFCFSAISGTCYNNAQHQKLFYCLIIIISMEMLRCHKSQATLQKISFVSVRSRGHFITDLLDQQKQHDHGDVKNPRA